MVKEVLNGFCMALADSVPGVSGGTVAFIMGFYDRFIGSIHNFVFGSIKQKKEALRYLFKLGIGWCMGMILAVLCLSSLFESHIYLVSSSFIGFILGSIPLIVLEEKMSILQIKKGIVFGVLGVLVVVLMTWVNSELAFAALDLSSLSLQSGIQLFLVGMIAISAMFLPGISGSTILLIFGMYIPIMRAIKNILHFNLAYVPSLCLFAFGILIGTITIVKGIQVCLIKYRSQIVYVILGMMIGSLYAIVQGPTTLSVPMQAMHISSFHPFACLFGFALVCIMEIYKRKK